MLIQAIILNLTSMVIATSLRLSPKMAERYSKYGEIWNRNELVLALYLYCQIPFARAKANNPEVIKLANLTGRTPSSVARKLGNFGAFDPLLTKSGIRGLTHVSKRDREIWDEFYGRWEFLVTKSQRLLKQLGAESAKEDQEEAPVISKPSTKTERTATALIRLYQAFFRRTILSSYETSCCVWIGPAKVVGSQSYHTVVHE